MSKSAMLLRQPKLFDFSVVVAVDDRQSDGGARRDRTDDLMLAKHALSQLSYGPVDRFKPIGLIEPTKR